MVSIIGVIGWFSAKIRKNWGIVSRGANPELKYGSTTAKTAHAPAPSELLALISIKTEIQDIAIIYSKTIKNTVNQSRACADGRKPTMRATATTIIVVNKLRSTALKT